MLRDEECHVSREPKMLTARELFEADFSGDVMLHNTMRFDVQLSYIQPMIDDGDVSKERLAKAIRDAIIEAVDRVAGKGLDGVSIPGGAHIIPVKGSQMFHRETICFDFS